MRGKKTAIFIANAFYLFRVVVVVVGVLLLLPIVVFVLSCFGFSRTFGCSVRIVAEAEKVITIVAIAGKFIATRIS